MWSTKGCDAFGPFNLVLTSQGDLVKGCEVVSIYKTYEDESKSYFYHLFRQRPSLAN